MPFNLKDTYEMSPNHFEDKDIEVQMSWTTWGHILKKCPVQCPEIL